jgi:hypothetical protein
MNNIERIADMMSIGYTAHEIIRILGIPTNQAEELLEQAEMWNDTLAPTPYTEEYMEEVASYYGEE